MLSVPSLVKPPTSGNCTILEETNNHITVKDLKKCVSGYRPDVH
ncbi:Uncharacterized protein FWK35_00011537 [Aphis craccivora]|uniref:Uncharacterized protein n=1 Tax=Aphis craccivora TaxID=307492 RepID=A0A6G0YN04_APHCR|nr:Uncharacterized protein FWK35_00011537 [Aphis craccivora]